MGVDAEELILRPFREVVESGKEAVTNAENVADDDAELSRIMLKFALAVVKEGERALKRIQPLWDGQVERYGDGFKAALSQNDDIEEKRRKLEDLLYDFEDYTEADTFEPDRFTEMQAATKSLALHVIDSIKTMKLKAPFSSPPYSPPPPSKFPPLPPLPPTMPVGVSRTPSGASNPASWMGYPLRPPRPPRPPRQLTPPNEGDHSASPSPPPPIPPLSPGRRARLVKTPPSGPSGFPAHRVRLPTGKQHRHRSHSLASTATTLSQVSQASATNTSVDSSPSSAYKASTEIPRVPLGHQDVQVANHHPTPGRIASPEPDRTEPAPQANVINGYGRPESPTYTDAITVLGVPPSMRPRQPAHSGQHGTRITAWVSDQAVSTSRHPHGHRPPSRFEPHSLQQLQSLQQMTIPEDRVVGPVGARKAQPSINFDSPLTPIISQLGKFAIESSTASNPSTMDSSSPERSRNGSSPTALSHATSMTSLQSRAEHRLPIQIPGTPVDERNVNLPPSSNANANANAADPLSPMVLPTPALESQPDGHSLDLTRTHTYTTAAEFDTRTVMSDHASTANLSSSSQARESDTAIGPRSSLYQMRGFCEGAQAFRTSGHERGVRKLAGHVAGASTSTARCSSCSYGHAFGELDLDINDRFPSATFPRPGGVLFRIRLLYKSHLGAPRPSEAFYGCLWCAQAGSVVREGDATVFKCSDDLFRHLATHPQPLPDVAGVTVLYGKEILTTDPRVNDFDLWLAEPTAPGGVPADAAAAADLHRLPVATATRNHIQRYAEKKLQRPEGKSPSDLLQFFVGARVMGVEFPPRHAGKWCTGWHDGLWGYFPAKSVELERPRPGRRDAPPLMQGIGGSGGVTVTATACWRWDPGATPSDKGGWLALEKGDKLTNVGWPADLDGMPGREAWCWSGTNSKGRFGWFPRTHIDESTVKEEELRLPAPGGGGWAGGAGATSKTKEGGGGRHGVGFFGVRRRHSTVSNISTGSGVIEII